MAKSDKTEKADADNKDVAMVTYIPAEGDLPVTKWGGITFKANVPTPVALTHSILVPMPHEVVRDGIVQRQHIETRVSLVDLARKNPSFSVDGHQVARKQATDRVPQTADQYRGYAIAWIAASSDATAIRVRWEGEENLRDACGIDAKDIAYIRPFLEAHLALKGGGGSEVAA